MNWLKPESARRIERISFVVSVLILLMNLVTLRSKLKDFEKRLHRTEVFQAQLMEQSEQ